MLLEYLATGPHAWLVQIVFLLVCGVGAAVTIGNKQSYKSKQLDLEYAAREASEKRRMETLTIEHAKPPASTAVAVIDHETRPRRQRSKRPS